MNKYQIAIIVIALFWTGMIAAISFLEAWVKFRAKSLTKIVGLDVGRTVFRAFQFVQLILAIILAVVASNLNFAIATLLIALVLIFLLIQIIFLFPNLNARTNAIIAGQSLPPAKTHAIYGVIEVIKFFLLFAIALLKLI